MTIRRILIANRGEIAVRIIRTCRAHGIESVLAASKADIGSVPARLADRTVCIGDARPLRSYLDVSVIVAAAKEAGADAIHPGYGFLSENAALARACAEAGIIFIGPTVKQIEDMGDKLSARSHAVAAGLPVLPGGPVASVVEAMALATEIGWPVLIKAVGGGGGRGMKLVREPAEMEAAVHLATAEAAAAFGDSRVYVERFVASGRHIEVQLLGDGETVLHLGDRDCSIQRRYQKLLEEAPAPNLPEASRQAMYAAAVALGRHLGYRGLGTVEFLFDRDREEFYFLEMNARIQVEHPVTEAITRTDLVAHQIAVAEGWPLRLRQSDIAFDGHAIECRINAEDWRHDFRPSPGRIAAAAFAAGPGIRVDTHIESDAAVPPFYDSLLAKLIVHGADRAQALERLRAALACCRIEGVATNAGLHALLAAHPDFVAGGVDTAWFPKFLAALPEAAHG
ncbi:MAG: ATP-grasp domain-containing protein [Rhodospirillales bacterium]|nr:ATP-grasp domain-containing protein [Rhodospirillales bacterium]